MWLQIHVLIHARLRHSLSYFCFLLLLEREKEERESASTSWSLPLPSIHWENENQRFFFHHRFGATRSFSAQFFFLYFFLLFQFDSQYGIFFSALWLSIRFQYCYKSVGILLLGLRNLCQSDHSSIRDARQIEQFADS